MHKVRFTIPRAMSPKDWASYDPAKYTAFEAEGWMLELEPENLIFWKDPRGFWEIADPATGRSLVNAGFKTRKDAMKEATRLSYQLHAFKTDEASKDHYAKLATVTDALAHELEILRSARCR